MKILLIRHGKAEERPLLSLSAKKDALRALTESGRREFRKAAKGLRKLAPDIDVLAASPLVRAQETAAIVLGAVVLGTLVGPLATQYALRRAGETGDKE